MKAFLTELFDANFKRFIITSLTKVLETSLPSEIDERRAVPALA